MASSRLARFVTEVAPSKFVGVMRHHRASKMLDTINEDEREFSTNDSLTLAPKSSASSTSSSSSKESTCKHFLIDVQRSYSILGN
ncbi:unnamed protein product [Ilex paraguariensis]